MQEKIIGPCGFRKKYTTSVSAYLHEENIQIIWNQVLQAGDGPSQSGFAPVIQTQRPSVVIYVRHQQRTISRGAETRERLGVFLVLEEAHFSPQPHDVRTEIRLMLQKKKFFLKKPTCKTYAHLQTSNEETGVPILNAGVLERDVYQFGEM